MSGDVPRFDQANEWRGEHASFVGRVDSVKQVKRAHRRVLLERVIDIGIPLAAIVLIGAALRHASNSREQILGALAGACVAITWATHLRWRHVQNGKLAAPSRLFVEASIRYRERERRVAAFVWAILAFELAFLIPWWAGGVRLHAAEPFATIAVLTLWLPIVAIIALATWSVLLWRRASNQLPGLRRVATELDEEEN